MRIYYRLWNTNAKQLESVRDGVGDGALGLNLNLVLVAFNTRSFRGCSLGIGSFGHEWPETGKVSV